MPRTVSKSKKAVFLYGSCCKMWGKVHAVVKLSHGVGVIITNGVISVWRHPKGSSICWDMRLFGKWIRPLNPATLSFSLEVMGADWISSWWKSTHVSICAGLYVHTFTQPSTFWKLPFRKSISFLQQKVRPQQKLEHMRSDTGLQHLGNKLGMDLLLKFLSVDGASGLVDGKE